MAEVIFTGEVTGYGSYDNDPPGYDIAYPDTRHPQTHSTGPNGVQCWGTAFGDGSYEYPLAMAGDINRHPAGTLAYDEVSQRYYQLVDYCAACQAPANPRLDLYVGGDLGDPDRIYSGSQTYRQRVDQASSNLTRIPGSTVVGRRLILNPLPGKPVPVKGPASGITSGCGNIGTAQGGGTTPPVDPPPPTDTQPCPGTVRTVKSFGYSWVSNGGSAIAYPGGAPRHSTAQGNGSWDNPATIAVENALLATYPKGSRLYIDKVTHADGSVAQVDKYGVVEDSASAGSGIGIWVGGAQNNGQRNTTTTNAQLTRAEGWVTGTATVIANPGLTSSCPVPNQSQIALDPNVTG